MNFKKFLKSKPKNILYYSFFDDSNFVADNPKLKPDDVIPVKDLGDWAFEYAIERIPLADRDTVDTACYSLIGGNFLEIAVACLGKEEVEKRLKELKKLKDVERE